MSITHVARVNAFNDWAVAQDWSARCDPSLAFESQALADLLAVWRAQVVDGAVPPRGAFTARMLKPFLKDIAIFERVAPMRYRVRLMGMNLTEVMGHMNGKFLEEVASPQALARWHAVLDLTLSEACPLRFTNRFAYRDREYLQAEALHLPLSDAGAAPSMALLAAYFRPN